MKVTEFKVELTSVELKSISDCLNTVYKNTELGMYSGLSEESFYTLQELTGRFNSYKESVSE